MNKDKLLALADYLDALPAPRMNVRVADRVGFQMAYDLTVDDVDYAERRCGTVACIGGHHVIRTMGLSVAVDKYAHTPGALRWAEKDLGLTNDQMQELFFGQRDLLGDDYHLVDMETVTPKEAAQVIRVGVETGRFDWRKVLGPERLI